MTAPAAITFRLLEPNALNRLLRALIRHRASLGLCPIIVHVFVTIEHGGREHYRVNTVLFNQYSGLFNAFCPICPKCPISKTIEQLLGSDPTPYTHPAARRQLTTYGFISSSTIRTSPTASSAGPPHYGQGRMRPRHPTDASSTSPGRTPPPRPCHESSRQDREDAAVDQCVLVVLGVEAERPATAGSGARAAHCRTLLLRG